MVTRSSVRIGTAGWAIPRAVAGAFPANGVGLARYAARLTCAEINATFHRPVRPATLERWAATVGDDFRFSVKAPRAITHDARLSDAGGALANFLAAARALGDRLGPLLVQLPPSLAWDPAVAAPVFARMVGEGFAVACEPRHASWFTAECDAWLAGLGVARVAADPARCDGAERPGGWRRLTYVRLHGSPRAYWSSYDGPYLRALSERLEADLAADRWCIFDNTASGAAAANALELAAREQ
ncbi:MAG: DUF72 domain-containing protein [Caulobacteraceae bacterium]|nr:DUF72 domain-containing protein [Caulobacteraceae bacterium]